MTTEKLEELQFLFGGFGYELKEEPGENPWVLIKVDSVTGHRVVVWRTRTSHTLWGLLRVLEHERGVR